MSERGEVVCGVDGGGTSTRVVLAELDGTVIGEGRSGSGNLHDVGEELLGRHLHEAWQEAWTRAGRVPAPAKAVFCAMASVGTASNRESVAEIAARVGLAPSAAIRVDIDLIAALAGGLGGEPGIALIAGTGSSSFGRDPSGRSLQVGGWGSLLDDVGGATWVGTQAMVAAVRAHDGRGRATTLSGRVLEHFGIAHMRELLPLVDADGSARARRAELARLVTAESEAGDGVATAILEAGARGLAECAGVLSERLDFAPSGPLVVVTGGLAEGAPGYLEAVHRAILGRLPDARSVLPRASNARGACLEALRAAHDGVLAPPIRDNVLSRNGF